MQSVNSLNLKRSTGFHLNRARITSTHSSHVLNILWAKLKRGDLHDLIIKVAFVRPGLIHHIKMGFIDVHELLLNQLSICESETPKSCRRTQIKLIGNQFLCSIK